jgi:hypothetical protein
LAAGGLCPDELCTDTAKKRACDPLVGKHTTGDEHNRLAEDQKEHERIEDACVVGYHHARSTGRRQRALDCDWDTESRG